jgi:hypothetical protein
MAALNVPAPIAAQHRKLSRAAGRGASEIEVAVTVDIGRGQVFAPPKGTARFTAAAKDPVPVPRNAETLALALAVATSSLPSRSRSPIAMDDGPVPTVKWSAAAKDPAPLEQHRNGGAAGVGDRKIEPCWSIGRPNWNPRLPAERH